jgi:2-keto-4-pentenoate hydratase
MSFDPPVLAALLLQARREGTVVAALPADLRPASLEDAYAVSRLVAARLGEIGGWKIGATSDRAMRMLGLGEPFHAPIPRSAITETSVWGTSAWGSQRAVTVDAEIVFELRSTPAAPGLDSLRAAVGQVRLGLEVNAPRYAAPFTEGGLAIVADTGANAGLVLGPALPVGAWDRLPEVEVRLLCGGSLLAQGRGEAVLDDPWRSLAWLVAALPPGAALGPGTVIASGNIAFAEVQPGQMIEADFGPYGSMQLRVSPTGCPMRPGYAPGA